MENIEGKTADAISQRPLVVSAGGKEYHVARPTLGTLIEISRHVGRLPRVGKVERKDIVPYILSMAGDSGETVARIAAILVIGEGNIEYRTERRPIGRFLWLTRYGTVKVSNVDTLADELRHNASPEEISVLVREALGYQNIGFFLSTIISLAGANVLEPTMSGTGATASGD